MDIASSEVGAQLILNVQFQTNLVISYVHHPLIRSCINHDKFLSMNNVWREYNKMKREIKSPENDVEYTL